MMKMKKWLRCTGIAIFSMSLFAVFEITEARLCYYVDLSSGAGVYDVKPVWIVKGIEKGEQNEQEIQVIIDAQTAEEILV